MESDSKNSSSEMDEHQGELMRNIMGQMGLTKSQQDQLIHEEMRNNANSEAILNNYVMRQLHENQHKELLMQQMSEMPYEIMLMKALGASSPEEAI